MFEQNPPHEETLQTSSSKIDTLFIFPAAEIEKPIILKESLPPVPQIIRLIFFLNPEEEKTTRLPRWLHEYIGWGVFLAILAGSLGIQIYLNRLLSGPVNQAALILSVVAEIGLLWQWDRYWY